MELESTPYFARGISSKAETQTLDSYENQIPHYREQNYTYIPIPSANQYYNTEEGWLRDISANQYIPIETHLLEVMRRLQDEPFLLQDKHYNTYWVAEGEEGPLRGSVSRSARDEDLSKEELRELVDLETWAKNGVEQDDLVLYSYDELLELYPQEAKDNIYYDNRYHIITISDLNKRRVKDMLYQIFAELVSTLGKRIEEEYPEPDSILKYVRAGTIGRWKKEQIRGMNLHIAEYINLIDMINILQASDRRFVQECGFRSKSDVSSLSEINEVRNAVMHANRSLIHSRRDISNVLNVVENTEQILSNME